MNLPVGVSLLSLASGPQMIRSRRPSSSEVAVQVHHELDRLNWPGGLDDEVRASGHDLVHTLLRLSVLM